MKALAGDVFQKLLREPLVHFLLLGALLFALYAALAGRAPPSPGTAIVLKETELKAAIQMFERTWQRAATADERAQLVENLVRDEVLYREGVALGLDRDDTLIRRRVRQKVEMLGEEAQEPAKVEDAELQSYLDRNRKRFELQPRVSFRQVYVDPERVGRDPDAEAARLLAQLRRGTRGAGDPTPLAHQVDDAALSDVERNFGAEFAAALMKQPPGQWAGPVRSAFGLHVVFVGARVPARTPPLAEVRDAVERDLSLERRTLASDALYRQLRQRYTVSIEPARPAGNP